MNSKLKLALKIVAGVGTLALLLLVIGVGLVLKQLPSPGEIAQNLKNPKVKEEVESVRSGSSTAVEANSQSADVAEETEASKDEESLQKAAQTEAMFRILEEDPRELHVCDNLGSSRSFSKDRGDEKLQFEEIFSDRRDDSVAEAMRFPIRAVLQDPQLKVLLNEIRDLQTEKMDEEEKNSFLNKIGFYARAASTARHLYQQKETFEYLGNRAVHLSLIAKLALVKPDLATDGKLQNFCRHLQSSLTNLETVDLEQERQEVLEMISLAGLTPLDLNFDPQKFIKFDVKSSNNSYSFTFSDEDEETLEN